MAFIKRNYVSGTVITSTNLNDIQDQIIEEKTVDVTVTISSLPATVSNSNVTAVMVVTGWNISNPNAMRSNWTVTCSNGQIVVAGTKASSVSSVTLYLKLTADRLAIDSGASSSISTLNAPNIVYDVVSTF